MEIVHLEGSDASQLMERLGEVKRITNQTPRGFVKTIRARTISRVAERNEEGFGMGLAIPMPLSDDEESPQTIQIANPEIEWVGPDNEVIVEKEELRGQWLITSGAQRCIPNPCPRKIASIEFKRTRSVRTISRDSDGNVTGYGSPVITEWIDNVFDDVEPVSEFPWQEWHEGCTAVASRHVLVDGYGGPECVLRHAQPVRDFEITISFPTPEPEGSTPEDPPPEEPEDPVDPPAIAPYSLFELIQCDPITARLFLDMEISGDYNETQTFRWTDERHIVSNMTWRYQCTEFTLNFAPGGPCRTEEDIAAGVQDQIRALSDTHPELAEAVVTVTMVEKALCDPIFTETWTTTEPDNCTDRNISTFHEYKIWGRIYLYTTAFGTPRFQVWEYFTKDETREAEGCTLPSWLIGVGNCCWGDFWNGFSYITITRNGGWSLVSQITIDCSEPSTFNNRVRSRTFGKFIPNPLVATRALPTEEVNLVNQLRVEFDDPVTWPDTLAWPAIVRPSASGLVPLEIQSIVLKRGSWSVTFDCDATEPDAFPTFTSFPISNLTRRLRSRIANSRLAPDLGWQWSHDCSLIGGCSYQINAGVTHEPMIRPYAGIDHPAVYLAGVLHENHIDPGSGAPFNIAYQVAIEGTLRLFYCGSGWSWRGTLRWRLDTRYWRMQNQQLIHEAADPWGFEYSTSPFGNTWTSTNVTQEFPFNQAVVASTMFDEHPIGPPQQWPVGSDSNGLLIWDDAPATFQVIPRA